jgi:glycosyltransferase involved in cell wall biosynthesis
MRMTWLAPDDFGGGVVSVAEACCRQAALAGHDATLLLALAPKGHAAEFGGFRIRSLDAPPPYRDIPARLVNWLGENPQDLLVLNGCEEADFAIPYIPSSTRVVYAVHDTAERYFANALRHEAALDAIVAVSRTVADRFRHRLRDPEKLHVVLNGTVLPDEAEPIPEAQRGDDLMFLGGDKPIKGAFDALALWSVLARKGFKGKLHWFGEVDAGLRAAIARLPAAERILVHGRQPRQAIFDAAAAAKVVLMLSRVEPFGMATIECMGMGCLAVAWDIPTGTQEIVAAGEGAFAPLGDFEALANGVLQSIEQHASRFRASSQRIRTEFSERAMWKRYETMLEAISHASRALRPQAGQRPPPYRPPIRFYQWLPSGLRSAIRTFVGRWPRLGVALRDFRGR